MTKKIILGFLGLAIVVAGIAVFTANTAQWVNVIARVEKEIEMACVDQDGTVTDCDYGVVFPENPEEKIIEVTLSNSFYNQDVKSDVFYWVLWECKQFDDGRDIDENGIPDCRVDAEHTDADLCYDDDHGKWVHCDGELDEMIRDFITVTPSDPSCLSAYNGPTGLPKYIEGIGNGVIDDFVQGKCFYHLAFQPPACEGHMNPYTDQLPHPQTVPCHEITTSDDPQDWDRFSEMGDDFKIQVYGFSFH